MSNERSLYSEDPGMTSVVSYPKRCTDWGNALYRGNCDGTLFKNLVLRYGAQNVADPMMGSATTRDVIAGLNRTGKTIHYWGGDLREGFDLLSQPLPGRYDFIWIHPPYWNIISYSNGNPQDLSQATTYEDFRAKLEQCLRRCSAALLPGGRLAVLTGDVRRNGRYFPIVRDVLNLEGVLGELRSIIIKQQHHCASDRKSYGRFEDVPIQHEYCLIFKTTLLPSSAQRAIKEKSQPSAQGTGSHPIHLAVVNWTVRFANISAARPRFGVHRRLILCFQYRCNWLSIRG